MTFAGTISGAGTLAQVGAGTLTLSAVNSHSGGTSVSAGTLSVSTDLNIGSANALLTLDGGRLLTTAGHRQPAAGQAGGGRRHDRQWRLCRPVFRAHHRRRGADLAGAGTVTLAADSSYTGGTTIAAGTLRLGDGGTTGSIVGDVANAGTLVFDRSNALVFDGVDQRHGRGGPAGRRHDHADRGERLYRPDQRCRRPAAGRRHDRRRRQRGERRAPRRHRHDRRAR